MSQYTLEILVKAIDDASKQLKDTGDGLDEIRDRAKKAGGALTALSAAGTAVIVSSALTAARTEVLGTVLETVGGNAGYSSEQLAYYEQAVKAVGITTSSTRQALIQMAQAEIDLASAADLARLSQDAAVIAQINSSEAFERLITATQRGNPIMLRTMGIVVDFQGAYKNLAAELGIAITALTAEQKMQARVNEVMSQGTVIAGTYEAAMGDVGKSMLSLPRHIEEAGNALGEAFLPMMGMAVDSVTNLLKAFNALSGPQKEAVSTLLGLGTVTTGLGGAALLATPKIMAFASALTGTTVAASAVLLPLAGVVAAITVALAAINETMKAHAEVVDRTAKGYEYYVEFMRRTGRAADTLTEAEWRATGALKEMEGALISVTDGWVGMHGAAAQAARATAVAIAEMDAGLQNEMATLKEFDREMAGVASTVGGAIGPFGGLASSMADLGKAFADGMPSAEDMWKLILQTERAAGASAEQLGEMAIQMGIATDTEVQAQLATFTLIDAYQQGERSMYDVATASSLMQKHSKSLAQAETLSAAAAEAAAEGHTAEAAVLQAQAEAAAYAAAEALNMATSIAEVGRVEDDVIQTGEDLARSQRDLAGALGEAESEAYGVRDALNSIPTDIDISIHTTRTSSGGMIGRGVSGEAEGLQHGHPYIPYDEFPAILHEGERVLTKSENKEYNDRRNYGGNTYNVYNPLAAAILAAEQQADVTSRFEARM